MIQTPDAPITRPPGAGKSSFDLIEPEKLLRELPLRNDMVFLDLGCGAGNYTLAVAEAIGKHGVVVALDLWQEGIETLEERAAAAGRNNLLPAGGYQPAVAPGRRQRRPLSDGHRVPRSGGIRERRRGPQRSPTGAQARGTLAIVEFDKVAGPPGPPLNIRLNPEEVENLAAPYGFRKGRMTRVGPYNYLLLFTNGEV